MCCTAFECACIELALLRFIYSPLGRGMCLATALHSKSNTLLSFSSTEVSGITSISSAINTFYESNISLMLKVQRRNGWKCREFNEN